MKKYKLIEPAAGLPAGAIVSGPAVEVLVNNGKAVPVADEDPKPKADPKPKKEGAK